MPMWKPSGAGVLSEWHQIGRTPQKDADEPTNLIPTSGLSEDFVSNAAKRFGPFLTSDDSLVVASDSNGASAVSATTGSVEWTAASAETVEGGGGRVYGVTRDSGELVGLDESDGTNDWTADLSFTGPTLDSMPAFGNDSVFIYNDEDEMFSVAASDGSIEWSTTPSKTGNGRGGSCYSSSRDEVYAVIGDDLLAFDAATGSEEWAAGISNDVRGIPTYGDGHVFIMEFNGTAYSVDATDGSVEWSDAWPEFARTEHSPAYDGTKAYFPGYGGSDPNSKLLLAMNMDGTRDWTFTGSGSECMYGGPSIDANGNIWFGTRSNEFYGVDSDGNQIFNTTLSVTNAVGTPAIAQDTLYMNTQGGLVRIV